MRRIMMPVAVKREPENVPLLQMVPGEVQFRSSPAADLNVVPSPRAPTVAEHVKALQEQNGRLEDELNVARKALRELFWASAGAPPFSREVEQAFRVLRDLGEM